MVRDERLTATVLVAAREDEDEIDELPDPAAADREQLRDADADVPGVEPVDPADAEHGRQHVEEDREKLALRLLARRHGRSEPWLRSIAGLHLPVARRLSVTTARGRAVARRLSSGWGAISSGRRLLSVHIPIVAMDSKSRRPTSSLTSALRSTPRRWPGESSNHIPGTPESDVSGRPLESVYLPVKMKMRSMICQIPQPPTVRNWRMPMTM